jgi:hypothetical protein
LLRQEKKERRGINGRDVRVWQRSSKSHNYGKCNNENPHVNDQAAHRPAGSRKQSILRDPTNKPKPPPLLSDNIPAELRIVAQWIAWRFDWINDRSKWDKPPTNPNNGRLAEANNPATWATFAQATEYAYRHHLDGVGFEFSADDPFAGIDLDDCRDPDTGAIDSWAQEIINEFNTYTEVSPTGTGVKLFVRGIVGKGIKTTTIELYDRGRYFIMTGQRLPNTPDTIAEAQPELDRLIALLRACF